jgi:hypothetical protein
MDGTPGCSVAITGTPPVMVEGTRRPPRSGVMLAGATGTAKLPADPSGVAKGDCTVDPLSPRPGGATAGAPCAGRLLTGAPLAATIGAGLGDGNDACRGDMATRTRTLVAISASAPATPLVTQSTTGDIAADRDVRFADVAATVVPVAKGPARAAPRLRDPLPFVRIRRGAIDRGSGAGLVLFFGAGADTADVVGVARPCVGARDWGAGVATGSGGGATVSWDELITPSAYAHDSSAQRAISGRRNRSAHHCSRNGDTMAFQRA